LELELSRARNEVRQEAPAGPRLNPPLSWLQLAILLALAGLLYHSILGALLRNWWEDPNFSHGFFVPIFSAYVVWENRRSLSRLSIRPNWFGLLVIAGALSVLVVGNLGAELFLSRSSFVLLLGGMIIFFAGWRYFRALLFPWAVLFLMIPIPVVIFNQITFPLQFMASRMATWLLVFVGVPVLREGNVIHLPTMTLEVVEACSGIRSLVSLVTLAVIYGHLAERSKLKRVALVLAAFPVAVVANGLRIMGTGLMGQYWNPERAEGFFHEFSGWVIFILSLGMLFLVHRSLSLWKTQPRSQPS
jgi:exosortase